MQTTRLPVVLGLIFWLASTTCAPAAPRSIVQLLRSTPHVTATKKKDVELQGWLECDEKGRWVLGGEVLVEPAPQSKAQTGPAIVTGLMRRETELSGLTVAASRIEPLPFVAADYQTAQVPELSDEPGSSDDGRKVRVIGAVRGDCIDGLARVVDAPSETRRLVDTWDRDLPPPVIMEIWGRWQSSTVCFPGHHELVCDAARVLHDRVASAAFLRLPGQLRTTFDVGPETFSDERTLRWIRAACWHIRDGLSVRVTGLAEPDSSVASDAGLMIVNRNIKVSRKSTASFQEALTEPSQVVAEGRLVAFEREDRYELVATQVTTSPIPPEAYADVTTDELLARPDEFNGKLVHLTGLYRYGFEVSTLDKELGFGPGHELDFPAETGGEGPGDYPEAQVETWGVFHSAKSNLSGEAGVRGHRTRFIDWKVPPLSAGAQPAR